MLERFFDNALSLCVAPDVSIRSTMEIIDRYASGIALVVDQANRLIATITDGDIRRTLLVRMDLDRPVSDLLREKASSKPVIALEGSSQGVLLALMHKHRVQQIPIVDERGCLVDLALLKNLQLEQTIPMQAVIMAGGMGTRLLPLTQDCPKPMLPIGGRPLLELTLDRLLASGIRNVSIATHHLTEKITDHFGDGSKFGVNLRYVQEHQPLGTGGALSLLGGIAETTLVINGDVVTDLDFRAMRQFHAEHEAAATMAVAPYRVQIAYGVVEHEGISVTGLVEKPVIENFINAGIYLVEPRVQRFMERDSKFNMTDLIHRLIAEKERVVVFPVREYWIDVGQHADYQRVQQDLGSGRIKFYE
jgi:dTDP-glucose pyrophosphorylase